MSGVLIGVASFILLGMILYAINLITFKLQYSLSEYTTGILFLLSGVVFPTSMLPYPLQIITDALPTKHFLNLARASILNIGNYMDDLILLALTTLAILFIAVILMYIIERKARIKGTIDRKAEY
jgi:ABC-2 type transport system permease protein